MGPSHASGRYWRRSRGGKSRVIGMARMPAFTRMPVYARIAVPILLILLIGRLAWQSVHSIRGASRSPAHSGATLASAAPVAPWQRDFTDSLDESSQDIQEGNITAAEFAVDRAESVLTAARLQGLGAQPGFFASALAALDRVGQLRPQDDRLFDHVTQARVSLAELRSSSIAPDSFDPIEAAKDSHPIRIAAPREIAADETLTPHSLGADYLDATLMPDTAEVLLPPASRSPLDDIRVENVTISGAAQTLDGIHWHNVTFIGTRLRYESGNLDLANVRFIRCRFGIPSDERGARLATALALGQSSITIQ